MRSLLRVFVYVPLGLLILFFALANRGSVRISLDPFPGGGLTGPSFEAPLFLVVLTSAALGVIAGGASSWLSHRQARRVAKRALAEAAKARRRSSSCAGKPWRVCLPRRARTPRAKGIEFDLRLGAAPG